MGWYGPCGAGFCYFDESHQLCAVNAINHLLPYAEPTPTKTTASTAASGEEEGDAQDSAPLLVFAAPQRLRADALDTLGAERRRPVTLATCTLVRGGYSG